MKKLKKLKPFVRNVPSCNAISGKSQARPIIHPANEGENEQSDDHRDHRYDRTIPFAASSP
ncbi:MAG TPA: hypothetical protein VFK44_04010 [Bacillales bacterium]|nr:hypothetical protein [Bacillales bacterium]